MPRPDTFGHKLAAAARPVFGASALRLLAYLGLCAAYVQGGLVKLTDFLLVAWLDLREQTA